MLTVLIVLLIILSITLGFFVLIQNPKGGGLATGGASSNMFGVQRTSDVLEKGTWVLLALIVVFSIVVTSMSKNTETGISRSKIQEQIDKTATPSVIGGNNKDRSTPAATPKGADPKKK